MFIKINSDNKFCMFLYYIDAVNMFTWSCYMNKHELNFYKINDNDFNLASKIELKDINNLGYRFIGKFNFK